MTTGHVSSSFFWRGSSPFPSLGKTSRGTDESLLLYTREDLSPDGHVSLPVALLVAGEFYVPLQAVQFSH